MRGLSPEATLTAAVAVGACNVEAVDALSGVPDWESVQHRLARGWERLTFACEMPGWQWESRQQIWAGLRDGQRLK